MVQVMSSERYSEKSSTILRRILTTPADEASFTVLWSHSYVNLAMQLLDDALAAVFGGDPYFKQPPDSEDPPEEEVSTTTRLNVHDGLAGCLIYISAAYLMIQNAKYKQAAISISKAIELEVEAGNAKCTNIGGSYGLGSILYGLAFAGVCLQEPTLVRAAYNVCRQRITHGLIREDKHLDVMHGCAGCILALIALLQADSRLIQPTLQSTERESVLQLAVTCGEVLLSKSEGDGWPTLFVGGFSHGVAGVAYALDVLSDSTGDLRYSRKANQARAYEDSLLSPTYVSQLQFILTLAYQTCNSMDNWARLPRGELLEPLSAHPERYQACAWCHGAAGIVMSRFAARTMVGAVSTVPMAAITHIESRLLTGSSGDTLCCGSLGCLEAVLIVNPQRALTLAAKLLSRFAATSIQVAADHYGLFQGVGGVALTLLRVVAPQKLPSVCLWQIP